MLGLPLICRYGVLFVSSRGKHIYGGRKAVDRGRDISSGLCWLADDGCMVMDGDYWCGVIGGDHLR